ncbi:MAG: TonB-dependent receptor [Sphingomonas sp.]|uniref:TonB-dependent receptor family protein n=1 Tax=Sphingomonas sp. TaxID=28214 RepID=UPI0025E9E7C3|nr:TonB-dependent receptor [Sphingomonas sp.]MBX9882393.1 TonB-dependent receptor [Sphingomonas sp.]
MSRFISGAALGAALLPCAAHAAPANGPAALADEVTVIARALPATEVTKGQAATRIDESAVRTTPATNVADFLRLVPGVAVIQGNGPRDVGVSIRGSNARNSFGARNIQVFEDDFPVTQPDGLARFDLADPHAYAAIEVLRGPSSARYGNYALGGAVNFRTRRGLNGGVFGSDLGADGFGNVYATIGDSGPRHDAAIFASFAGADGATAHNDYRTFTLNAYATADLGARDRVAVKFIANQGLFRLSTRLSFDQYRANPYQQGCEVAARAAAGCGAIAVFANGTNGARVSESAAEADLARDDRRLILGLRHEHDLSAGLSWRTQVTLDNRDAFQPTNATPFRGTLNSLNLTSELTRHGRLFGLSSTSFVGFFYNILDNQSFTFTKAPGGRERLGALAQTVTGDVRNWGLRARQELAITSRLHLIAGLGAERSTIVMTQTVFSYPLGAPPRSQAIPADRRFWNVAPEAALAWQATQDINLHARVATGYGIPQSGNLFVTPQGVFGNNLALKAQSNIGAELGAELTMHALSFSLALYQEWFRNELITQSAGVNLLSYTANAPRSVHRGIDLAIGWRPPALPGTKVDLSYGYTDQFYTDFSERLSNGQQSLLFSRGGNAIPGVIPHFLNLRAGFDQPSGRRQGLGGFAEVTWRGGYFIDNGNQLRIPGYALLNLNLHYDPPAGGGRFSLYLSVQNALGATYVGSASVIANSLGATGAQNGASVLRGVTGSIYAGQPRTLFGGVKTRF